MSTIRRFEEIEAWQTARELTREIYSLSNRGGFSKDFGLRDQMRRAAVSVMSNIAEGFESRTTALFVEFLGRAKGSAGELRAQTTRFPYDRGEAPMIQILLLLTFKPSNLQTFQR